MVKKASERRKNKKEKKTKKLKKYAMEDAGIDPATSRMLSGRSTI